MNDQELREAIRDAKAAEQARLQSLYEAHDALREIRDHYTGIGSRSTNKIVTRAVRAITAIREMVDEMTPEYDAFASHDDTSVFDDDDSEDAGASPTLVP